MKKLKKPGLSEPKDRTNNTLRAAGAKLFARDVMTPHAGFIEPGSTIEAAARTCG